jgi:O-antigen/teichoic acid export membrane protein
MSRKKLFFENIFAYGFIDVLSKILPFILLPVITRMLSPTEFGVYNLYNLLVGFGMPLAMLGLYVAMFREYFEKEDQQYKYDVTTTTLRIILLSSIIISVVLVVFNKIISNIIFGESTFGIIIIFSGIGVFLGAIKLPVQGPTRMQNQRKVYVVSGLLSSFVTYGLSLALLYFGYSYFGLIYASLFTSLIMIIFFWVRNKAFFLKGSFNKKIAKELFSVGLPLLPTFLIYWVYNSMDKIMITNMLGTFELGIYSVGAKMAQVSQIIYSAFAGGWQYFAFSTMKDDDQVELNSKVFEYLAAFSIMSLVFVYPFIQYIFKILFKGNFVEGYIVAPYLFLSPLLLMLFQVVTSQFVIAKKSYLATMALSLGATINVILNIFLIKTIGIEGASIATLIGYSVSILLVMLISYRYKLMVYNRRIIYILALAPLYLYIQRVFFHNNASMQFTIMLITIVILIILYRLEVRENIKILRKKITI